MSYIFSQPFEKKLQQKTHKGRYVFYWGWGGRGGVGQDFAGEGPS